MLLKISKFFLYASVFAVVVVMPSTFFPFIGGKYYFFRVAVELALTSFVLWWAFEPEEARLAPQRLKEIFRKPIVIAVTVFAGVFLLASIFAYDANAAFWSNYERGDGGFQMLHYYFFFVLLVAAFRDWEDWKKLFWVSLAAAVLMVSYGFLANVIINDGGVYRSAFGFYGPYVGDANLRRPAELPGFWERLFGPRFQGSLGNPAYVAPYLMFSIFYAAWLWFAAPNSGRRWGYGLLIAVFFFFFWLAQTRGAFLGLVAAVIAFLGFVTIKGNSRLRLAGAWSLALLLLLGGLLFSFRETLIVRNLPGGRFFDISLKTQELNTRFWTWGSAWQGFKERPLLGWGPENFSAVFDKYFDPRHFVPGKNTETWFDRAHGIIFDYLAETGILGLGAFLGMWAVFFWCLFKKKVSESAVLNGLLFALPVGYLVQGLAIFDVLPIYMNIFIFLAFAAYIFNKNVSPY